MSSEGIWDVRITDTSLRDGSHHKRHQFTKEEVSAIVAALDAAGVPVIVVPRSTTAFPRPPNRN